MSRTVYFRVIDGDWMECSWTFDPTLAAAIKGNVPGSQRSYNPGSKTWSIHALYWEIAERTMRGLGYHVREVTPPPPKPPPQAQPSPLLARQAGPYAELGLLPSAPQPVVDAALRALAKVYHPDAGSAPDAERMSKINAAYTRIKEERRKAEECDDDDLFA